ncbi:unnamed protein product [Sphagnum tenellum]
MTMPSWVQLLIMDGILLAVFLISPSAAAPAPEPSPSPLCCCCSRALFTTLWGFAFAFGGLTLDAWHTADAHIQRAASFRTKLYYAVSFGPVAPFPNLLALFYDVYAYTLLSLSLNNMPAPQRELTDKAAKIIANCKVVLGTSEGRLPQTHGTLILPDTTDHEHALVLGRRLPENSYMVQLNYLGKEALLRSGVLPGYRRLQLLQGNRSFAVVLYGMQAFGYMAAVMSRGNMGLVVSPIETIGFTFSNLVVIHSVCHFVVAPCHRPLIVYLRPDQEQDNVFQMCQSTQCTPIRFWLVLAITQLLSVIVGTQLLMQPFSNSVMSYPPGTPPVHCIVAEDSRRGFSWIFAGPSLFTCCAFLHLIVYVAAGQQFLSKDPKWIKGDTALGLPRWHDISLQILLDFIDHVRGFTVVRRDIWILIIDCILSLGTVSAMILALVATIVYWDENFAERTTGIVHIWPFIG